VIQAFMGQQKYDAAEIRGYEIITASVQTLRIELFFPLPPSIHPSIYGSTALMGLGTFFSFLIYTQSVALLGRGISPSQGRYLHTE
jgi:hypothetical protein